MTFYHLEISWIERIPLQRYSAQVHIEQVSVLAAMNVAAREVLPPVVMTVDCVLRGAHVGFTLQ